MNAMTTMGTQQKTAETSKFTYNMSINFTPILVIGYNKNHYA